MPTKPPLGRILIATVEGDIHDIGKNIPATRILEVALAEKVDAVGLSALMTTTLQQMDVTLRRLREAGVKVFTMIGGAVVSREYADSIGADIYARDTLEAVAKVKQLLKDKNPE